MLLINEYNFNKIESFENRNFSSYQSHRIIEIV